MDKIYSPIKPLKISDETVRHIKSLIIDGKLRPGEKFPSERNLASLLGVGRSTLREAMKTLTILGFVKIKERRGAYVRNLGASVIPDSFAQIMDEDQARVKDLYQLRKDLEVGSSYVAATTRTVDDLKQMAGFLEILEGQVAEPQLGIKEDIDFHLAIARATRNLLRIHVLENLFDRYGYYIDIARKPILRKMKHNETVCSHHRLIFKSIEQKKPEEARMAMHMHLSWVEAHWERRKEL